jgi:hypothetical protein
MASYRRQSNAVTSTRYATGRRFVPQALSALSHLTFPRPPDFRSRPLFFQSKFFQSKDFSGRKKFHYASVVAAKAWDDIFTLPLGVTELWN